MPADLDFRAGAAAVLRADPSWPQQFERVAQELRDVLGRACTALDHVGGSSVAGLPSRPVIDVLAITPHLTGFDNRSALLRALGYGVFSGIAVDSARAFYRAPRASCCAVSLIVTEPGDREAVGRLLVRDLLRSHPAEAAAFGTLKQRLAREHDGDETAYQNAKSQALRSLLDRARGRRSVRTRPVLS